MTPHRTLSLYNDRGTRIDGTVPVIVNDCTLREGEQSALVNFLPAQKVATAKRLAEAGVSQIQVGYPGLSRADFSVFRELKGNALTAKLEAVVLGYLPNWREQIEAAAEAGADVVSIVYVTSKPRYEQIFRATPAQVRERTQEVVSLGKNLGMVVSFAPADTTRTELDFALEIISLAEASGADRIFVADTVGAATPGAVRWLVEQVHGACALPIQFHGHNDFSFAVANAIAAVEAGATIIDTTLNGWGDRTGNPPTEEFVAVMELLYNNPVGVNLAAIAALAREIAEELRVPVPATKPITGSLAFAHKLETHVKAVTQHPPAFEGFDPVLVGGRRHVAVGQYTGPEALAARMAEMGIRIDTETAATLSVRVQEAARATNEVLNDDDLRRIAREAGFQF